MGSLAISKKSIPQLLGNRFPAPCGTLEEWDHGSPPLVGYGFPTARSEARAFPPLVGYGFPTARSEAREFS